MLPNFISCIPKARGEILASYFARVFSLEEIIQNVLEADMRETHIYLYTRKPCSHGFNLCYGIDDVTERWELM